MRGIISRGRLNKCTGQLGKNNILQLCLSLERKVPHIVVNERPRHVLIYNEIGTLKGAFDEINKSVFLCQKQEIKNNYPDLSTESLVTIDGAFNKNMKRVSDDIVALANTVVLILS
jgi:hypothetical protein